MSLELGKGHFDWIEVWAVGRQEEKPGAPLLEDGFGLFAFVTAEVVENDHVAQPQGRCELGFHIGLEEGAVDRSRDDPRSGQAVIAQGGDEGLGAPVIERRPAIVALSTWRPAS